MLNLFLAPFQFPFMVNAIAISIVVAIPCALLSVFLVLKGWALMGDAMSHAVFPGVVLAYIIGIPFAIGAFIAGLLCAVTTGFLDDNSRLKRDTIMGIVFSGMFGAGLVLYVAIQSDVHLDHILFGDMLGISLSDIGQTTAIALVIALIIGLKWRDFLLHAFDPTQAKASGLRSGLLHYGLLCMIALTIVAALWPSARWRRLASRLPLLLAAVVGGAPSCSDDDGVPGDPEGTVSLNMMDESNGKTVLDDSGIYIDKAQNFVTGGNCVLFAFGKVGGLGAVAPKSLETSTTIAAVEAGHGYVAVRPGTLRSFPSGKMAMPIGRQDVNYLKIYVVSPLTAESKTVGAAVRYVTAMPGTYKLPEYGSTALRIDHSNYDYLDQEVALSLPGGDVECDLIDNGYDIRCEQRGGKLYIRLGGWFARRFELYLRSRESYTMVYVDVDVPL